MQPRARELAAHSPLEPSYLLIIDGHVGYRFDLPSQGELIIGRAPDVAVQLEDSAASRHHARLDIGGGEVWVSDLGSRNGTRLNGENLVETRALVSGDVISICGATLVFHRDGRLVPSRSASSLAQLRLRLQEEVERSARYGRPLSLLCLRLANDSVGRPAVLEALSPKLRLLDVLCWVTPGNLLVLLPELDRSGAEVHARQLVHALQALGSTAQSGLVSCPEDAAEADALISAAQSATLRTAGTQAEHAASTVASVIELGDQQVTLAEPAMKRLYNLLERLAPTDLPVLITGETGVGKEMAARSLHFLSRRKTQPLLALNCAALPETLVESELFGYERGAFSGASSSKAGLLEAASGGTLILDEIGEMPLSVQAKLLRVLETQRVLRVGDLKERPISVRIVATTNRLLAEEVRSGRFRQDLYFRLSAARVLLPPLRDRPIELPLLARAFLAQSCARHGRPPLGLAPATLHRLLSYRWPGNLRELRNVMDFVAATQDGDILLPEHIEGLLESVERCEVPLAPGTSERAARASQHAAPAANPTTSATPPHSNTELRTATAAGPSSTDPASSSFHTGPALAADRPGATGVAMDERPFRPIDEEVRELERLRMSEALGRAAGVQVRAAELLGMPIRTFTAKLKQYGISPREGRRKIE